MLPSTASTPRPPGPGPALRGDSASTASRRVLRLRVAQSSGSSGELGRPARREQVDERERVRGLGLAGRRRHRRLWDELERTGCQRPELGRARRPRSPPARRALLPASRGPRPRPPVARRGRAVTSTTPGGFSAAVRGTNAGTGGLGIGVYGSQAGSGLGRLRDRSSGSGERLQLERDGHQRLQLERDGCRLQLERVGRHRFELGRGRRPRPAPGSTGTTAGVRGTRPPPTAARSVSSGR